MSSRDWESGTVALVEVDGQTTRAMRQQPHGDGLWSTADRCKGGYDHYDSQARATVLRPLLVIDPEDWEQVNVLAEALCKHRFSDDAANDAVQAALRSLAGAPNPEEPADPKARVTDRRDNIWRLLADGDWVCTSGPDIGEYLTWDQLAGDRGPVAVSA